MIAFVGDFTVVGFFTVPSKLSTNRVARAWIKTERSCIFSYGFCHCKICVTKRMNLNVHHFNLLIFYWFIGNVQCTLKRRSVHHLHEMLNNSRKTLDSEFPKPFTASCGKLSILWCFLTLTKPLSVKTLYKRYTESVTFQDGVQWYRNSAACYCRTNEAKMIIAK